MKTPLKLSIPNRCHENWSKMTPTEKGRFCSICKKNVYDFTKASDLEIITAFNENENLCGRFKTSQLNRDLLTHQQKRSFWLMTATSVIALLGLGNYTAKAQGGARPIPAGHDVCSSNVNVIAIIKPQMILLNTNQHVSEDSTITIIDPSNSLELLTAEENQICSGSLYNIHQAPLPNMYVKNERTGIVAKTDSIGRFSLSVKKDDVLFCSDNENFDVKNKDFYISDEGIISKKVNISAAVYYVELSIHKKEENELEENTNE